MVINDLPVGFKDGLRHFSSQQKHLIKPSSGQITPNRSLGAQHQWLQWNIWAQKKTTSFLYVGMGSLHIYAYMASWWSGSKSFANKILRCEMMWATIQLDPLWHVYICSSHPHFDFLFLLVSFLHRGCRHEILECLHGHTRTLGPWVSGHHHGIGQRSEGGHRNICGRSGGAPVCWGWSTTQNMGLTVTNQTWGLRVELS